MLEEASDLEFYLLRLLDHPLLSTYSRDIIATVKKFKHTTTMNMLLSLAHLDAVREDLAEFLNLCLQEMSACHEFKLLIKALSEHLTNLQSQAWHLVQSSKLSDPEVATQVMIALVGTQQLMVNYHCGILDRVVGRLGLAAPCTINPPCSVDEGMLHHT